MLILKILPVIFLPILSGFAQTRKIDLVKLKDNMGIVNVELSVDKYKGKACLKVVEVDPAGDKVALIPGISFCDGVIEVEVAGNVQAGAFEGARGFIGLAFRVDEAGHDYESFYLRPTNGRSDDQIRRNHSTQYVSHPEYTWQRLRKESPEKYESYVDIVPGEWTKIKVEVKGDKAKLYVHGAEQPSLIVNDLKKGADRKGTIALWIGLDTVGYFANLKVTSTD